MRTLNHITLAAAFALSALPAHAVWIVDTGAGPSGVGGWSLYDDEVSFQHLAATFTVESAATIGYAAGWIGGASGGQVAMQLFAAGSPGDTPLYSVTMTVGGYDDAWHGVGGLHWAVGAGDYTLAFVAQPGFGGWMSSPVPNALTQEWYWSSGTAGWAGTDGLDFGVRVAAVPEPAAYGLMAIGLLAVGAGVRRNKRAR